MADEASSVRSSQGSSRRAPKNPQQQLSQIEKSVTHLLVATKQLLETLTLWSRGTATESEVSDVYVRLGYEFNIASRAFNAIGVDTTDLGNVPELLRGILEETLSQEASQTSLDNFLPRIRDIIINLLHGLKKKQQRLRQRTARDASLNGGSPRQGSIASTGEPEEPQQTRASSQRLPSRNDENGHSLDRPPRSSSVAGTGSLTKYDALPANPRANRNTGSSHMSTDSSMSSTTAQQMPVIAPYPTDDAMPATPDPSQSSQNYPAHFPPPPPPPKQEDALAALQRGGELERRASRRFSAYQIQKHLGTNGIPLPPVQNSPIPNRGRDVRESMSAVRTRGSTMHSRQRSNQQRPTVDTAVDRTNHVSRRISEESSQSGAPVLPRPQEPDAQLSPMQQTPEDMLGKPDFPEPDGPSLEATSGPLGEPIDMAGDSPETRPAQSNGIPVRNGSRRAAKSPSPQPQPFVPDLSPQAGKELTLFLQYKSKIKKYVFSDGSELSAGRLQLAFIEKFAWDTHRHGELPEIHIQDPVSGVRYELDDLNDIKERSVLVLNVEQLDEVKNHIDEKFGGLRELVESIKTVVTDQQSAIDRVAERQQQTARELAGIAAAPPPTSARNSALLPSRPLQGGLAAEGTLASAAQLSEVQALRRDLAVVRQTYSSFVSDIQASMSAVRTKATAVKSTAVKAALPTLDGDTGRAYINTGKKNLQDESEKIVNRVDDLQDLVEDLRKDVVMRGVRPLPRQLEVTAKDLSRATAELKKLQDFLAKEKPLWTKIWEQELQTVCEERDLLTMQEELAADLQDDLEKATQTFELVEQATKQQNLQNEKDQAKGTRSASGQKALNAVAMDKVVDPRQARDGVLGEVKALQPNHESRLEAIERAEKARQRDLETRRDDEFKRELGDFVTEGKLKKSGGVEEVERVRLMREERARKEHNEREAERIRKKSEKMERQRQERMQAAAEAAAQENGAEDKAEEPAPAAPTDAPAPEAQEEAKEERAPSPEGTRQLSYTVRPWVKSGIPLPMQMLAHTPMANQFPHSPSPPLRVLASTENTPPNPRTTATPLSIDASPPSSRARTHKSASLSLRARDRHDSSRKSTPTRRPRGNTAPTAPCTPDRRDGAESALSFTPSMRGQQLASWLSGLLGRGT
ncbi:AIP3-domain-containing protein [Didymella exigua CBS 183.55]|uniref:AIP3-domain-containing protein n=1 Tax=Didymella exigua CBS 183.55 TaxID=1150837 RepID=A0A6A5RJI1_9PLEO|nr:AIP3-domain-containing protein [Didymella exigua CBS 183.55]KAF1928541.1 AIP3-domain-containing protein [Didymella exigua CBS 183.55]